MDITVDERARSPVTDSADNAADVIEYVVRGTDSEAAARSAVEAVAPELFRDKPLRGIRLDPQTAGIWYATATYSSKQSTPPAPPPEPGESVFNFETGGGTQHITQSLQTVGAYAPSGRTPPNFQGAIGVTDDGVEGVDITIPIYNFSETHYKPASFVTTGYRSTLFALTGRVNSAPFKGLGAGECLFLGATGTRRGTKPESDWEITYRFAGSPNVSGLSVGPISGISKRGWEYLWVRYAEAEDPSAQAIVKRPVAAYVERVYEPGNFSALGIGS